MQKFKPRDVPPPTVEAAQLTLDNIVEIVEWSSGREVVVKIGETTHVSVEVDTPVGKRRAFITDYLVKDEGGLFTVQLKDLFESQFESVPSSEGV